MTNNTITRTTVPALDTSAADEAIVVMQARLASLIDLQLTLKHIHWNVVGMNFIAVHEMLDPQVDAVRAMSDAVAERIATLGGQPRGTPGAVASSRTWGDYGLDRAPTVQHLVELDKVYDGVAGDHRAAIATLGELDPVSEDLFIGQLAQLELFQWFVRAHLKDSDGDIMHRRTDG
ncbi:Dps family protein [Ilumatobacter sp.]|uniref:Dps family protein n=1 Tax=Ilumatobacter sp. TaxID=1967498 RepID=UPI003C409F2C